MKTIHPNNYLNKDLCIACGGACCKKLPGQYAPSDFKEKLSYDSLKELLLSGDFSIDWYEGSTDIFYLRPRTTNGGMIDASWGGTCIHWSKEIGCELSDKGRPLQCRMLKPGGTISHFKCSAPPDEFSKLNMAKMWLDYQPILLQLVNELKRKEDEDED